MIMQYPKVRYSLDAHSRGTDTLGNMLESLADAMKEGQEPYNINVVLRGPARNAASLEASLSKLNGKPSKAKLQNHEDDFVGRVIGRNPATYGGRPEGSSKLLEWIKIPFPWPSKTDPKTPESTSHNCYGYRTKLCEESGYPKAATQEVPYPPIQGE
jgi:filamentous hemagglutinin